jgi:DNA-binding transcriptional LysR family regulator
VRPTEAGKQLLDTVSPALHQIAEGLAHAKREPDELAGKLRLTATEHPARTILIPVLSGFLSRHRSVTVDLHVSDRFTDIVQGGFDAGIRFGAHLEKDMVAVPISPDVRALVVAAPDYLSRRGRPQQLEDLADHDCLNYRTASFGDLFRWRFQQGGRNLETAVEGQVIVNDGAVLIEAALAGLGLAYVFEPLVATHLAAGRLESCLEEFSPVWSGYHLYYPSRKQKSSALAALLNHLRAPQR